MSRNILILLVNLSISNLLNSILVKVDPTYFRPTEVDLLLGDPTKSNTQLGWTPEYDLAGLVNDMMICDIKLTQKDMHLVEKGHEVYRQSE
ncbi:GDP-mannose 4,6-dehydratase [Algoriphagus sp. C2-6-M1]|uniref:GDP-mannose 4,6-dehydratase n=1 Tax=Algoriphagus persicinus TaxID=3108754 RepID=UPI002B3D5393|nr:GDP-mannose 4,6-dehydratase [Algoriphagus sp. C2-6-M1]MEB2782978.1 GDP-mannose 4,6-dehydratase [Algoriphagus sp. C2-6-M1]